MNALNLYKQFLSSLVALRLATGDTTARFAEALRLRRQFLDMIVPDLEGKVGEITGDKLAQITSANVSALKIALDAPRLAAGMTGSIAELAKKMANLTEADFFVPDSAGKSWPATRMVEMVLSNYALQSGVDRVLAKAAETGHQQFVVTNPKEGHRFHGLHLTLEQVLARRDEIFHPGSKSELSLA